MVDGRIGVFVTEETDALFFYHFNKCNLINSIKVFNDIDKFRSSPIKHKISCLQMPYPVRAEFDSLVDDLVNCSDHVLILMSELHDRTVEIVQRHDDPKVSYFICGEFNFELTHSPLHKFYDWFTTTVHFYKHIRPQTLDILTPYNTKSFNFDCLLGRKKAHRDFAYDRIKAWPNNVLTYLGDHTCNFDDPEKWLWESNGLEIDRPVEWTVDRVPYYGHRMSISQIVPLQIYNQTAYTLVAETNYSNHYTFYTEKTVKPILGRRLFVALAGQGHLANLHRIGFKTFDSIIDESYDTIANNEIRWQTALEQMQGLSKTPQEEILDKIKPICEHNYKVMIETDWYGDYFLPAFVSYFNQ
jgi:hypothetical protein